MMGRMTGEDPALLADLGQGIFYSLLLTHSATLLLSLITNYAIYLMIGRITGKDLAFLGMSPTKV